MQSEVSPARSPVRSPSYIPLDPARKQPLHWTQERRRRVHWKYAILLIFLALMAGFVAGQMLPQLLG